MKIKVDYEYTMGIQLPQVKNDIKEFKNNPENEDQYIVSWLLSEKDLFLHGDIIKATAEAFPAGAYYGDKTIFSMEFIIDNVFEFLRVKATIDSEWKLYGNITINHYN